MHKGNFPIRKVYTLLHYCIFYITNQKCLPLISLQIHLNFFLLCKMIQFINFVCYECSQEVQLRSPFEQKEASSQKHHIFRFKGEFQRMWLQLALTLYNNKIHSNKLHAVIRKALFVDRCTVHTHWLFIQILPYYLKKLPIMCIKPLK